MGGEITMGTRIQMNEDTLDLVNGGAFNFYDLEGQGACYVDGVGTFYCNDKAATWIVEQMSKPGASASAIADEAVARGLFWS